jgi:hypothetical protein
MRSLHLSLEQETSTDGMEFTGPAATVYEKVHGDYMNATAEELWDKMQRRLYSEAQVQAQHSRLHTVKLGADETIEDFSQRIRDLGTGLSEAAEDAMLRQSFREGVITTLKYIFWLLVQGLMRWCHGFLRCPRQRRKRHPEWVRKVQRILPFLWTSQLRQVLFQTLLVPIHGIQRILEC